jgi:biotin carboxylase
MDKAISILDNFDDRIDGIIGFWDFPVSILQTILAERYKTIATSTQSVYFCEDKYGSRAKQTQVIPECVPCFRGFDPFDDQLLEKIGLNFPFWVKPVKSFGSYLGFRIENEDDFNYAIGKMRSKIKNFTDPFFNLVDYSHMEFQPDRKILAIAEEIISGHQCTLEGYVFNGEVNYHGVIDSHRYEGMSTFSHYQYPSVVPDRIKKQMFEYARKFIEHIEFDNSAFNIEFYWNQKNDELKLLEINPRISQSHAELFKLVDGVYNHKVILDIALGNMPKLPNKEGNHKTAGKFFIRHFENGVVKKAPDEKSIARIKEKYPEVVIELLAKSGDQLEDLPYQDSYSYKLGFVYLGGENSDEMKNKFEDVKKMLDYQIG